MRATGFARKLDEKETYPSFVKSMLIAQYHMENFTLSVRDIFPVFSRLNLDYERISTHSEMNIIEIKDWKFRSKNQPQPHGSLAH